MSSLDPKDMPLEGFGIIWCKSLDREIGYAIPIDWSTNLINKSYVVLVSI